MYQIINEKTCDFAVVGGGGGGLVAAVRAAQAGLKVILMEKGNACGGGMLFASTMRTFGSKWQAERNLPDVTDSYARKMLDSCYWRIDPAVVAAILPATGKFFDWFIDYAGIPGDSFSVGRYVFDDESGPLGPQYGRQHNGFGRVILDTLSKRAPEEGVEMLMRHRVVDAETKDGKLSALIAETENGTIRVNCKAALLAPGSWINKREITESIVPDFFAHQDPEFAGHLNPHYTGDCLQVAESLGAYIDKDSFVLRLMGPMNTAKSRTFSGMAISPYIISVNLNGKRYAAEPLLSHMAQFDAGSVIAQQPEGIVFNIFNNDTLRETLKLGQLGENIKDINARGQALPATMEEALADIESDINNGVKLCYRANTLEELAQQTGVDPEGLKKTVADYNSYCEAGFDWGCFKPKEGLLPLKDGPYYAVQGFLASDGAFGGVKVNQDMQAYAKDGGLVEGLYVTGDFASGRHVSAIDGTIKLQFINDMNWSLAGSYIAGEKAAAYVKSLF